MAYDISLALERLEKNLQDINSAKKQVEDTINASSQLQNVVNGYVTSVNTVLQETILLKEEIGKMKNQKVTEVKEAVAAIEASCTAIISAFKEDTSSILADLSSENDRLTKSNEFLRVFQTKLEQSIEITSVLKTKQDKVSADVLSIHNSQQEATENISKQYDQLSQRMDASITVLTDSMDKDFGKLSKQTEELHRAVPKTQMAIEDLGKQISEQHVTNLKNININRWILIIGILLIAALQFVIK